MSFRLLYILPGGRAERMQFGEGKFPDEFFYGYCQLARCPGWQADLTVRTTPSGSGLWLQKLVHWFVNLSPDFSNAAELSVDMLKRYDAIVSMSEPVLFMLALRKRGRRDGAGLALIQMGADKRVERSSFPSATRRMLKWLYGKLDAVIVIGEGERDYLLGQRLVEPDRLHLIQFGVDTTFWTPLVNGGDGDYVLAVGNDDGRDYETLLAAIGTHRLRLHTSRSLGRASLPTNVVRTSGDWSGQALSDLELRELYRNSRFVVTPLKESAQPQGQSVTLQAMACGKAVILSKTRGLWSPEAMRHLENCYLVPPGDAKALRDAINRLDHDADLRARLGQAARHSVERNFSSTTMGERIGDVLQKMRAGAGTP